MNARTPPPPPSRLVPSTLNGMVDYLIQSGIQNEWNDNTHKCILFPRSYSCPRILRLVFFFFTVCLLFLYYCSGQTLIAPYATAVSGLVCRLPQDGLMARDTKYLLFVDVNVKRETYLRQTFVGIHPLGMLPPHSDEIWCCGLFRV